tara:strand:- start:1 stop:747 length:747 start_codon:yes stop_codon:yes gene_type:complete
MEYLVVILIIIILYILIRTLRIKERFVRTLLSPDVLEVVKTGRQAKITFQRNQEDKLKLGDTDPNQKYEYLIFYVNADSPNQGIWVQRKVTCNSNKCEFVLKNLSGKRYHMAIVETQDERISSVKKIIKFSNSKPYKLLDIKSAPAVTARNVSEEEKKILGEETDFKDEPEIIEEDQEEESSSPSPYIVCGNNPRVKYVESEGDMEDIEVRSKCEQDDEIDEIREKVNRSLWNEFKKGYLTLDLNLVN